MDGISLSRYFCNTVIAKNPNFQPPTKKYVIIQKKELRHHGAMKKHTVCRSFLLKKGVVFHEINRPR